MQIETFEVDFEHEGERLDKYISMLFPEQSRSFFQKIIKEGHVTVNNKPEKANYRLTFFVYTLVASIGMVFMGDFCLRRC